jgi:methionyl-tRNA formyltransferase
VDYVFNFLSPVVLERKLMEAAGCCVNFHPGPPEYPGVGGASYALFDGVMIYGATAHMMEEKVDAGRILEVKRFRIEKDWGCEELFHRACESAAELCEGVMRDCADGDELGSSDEIWKAKPKSRSDFEAWMDVTWDDESVFQRKCRALKHRTYAGPYTLKFGKKMWILPGGEGR